MRRTFSTVVNNNAVNAWLLVSRIAVGAIMLTHGIPKLQRLIAGDLKFANPIGIGETPSFILVVFAEAICSALIMLGLATRLASFVLIINMCVITFVASADQPFAKKEMPLLYLLFYIGFCILGAGKYSIDNLISGKNRSRY